MSREPIIFESGKICSSSVETYLETDVVPNNKLFTCMSLAAVDMTHPIGTRLELGVVDGNAHIPIRSQKGPFPSKTSGNAEYPVIVLPGQRLYALFVTPQSKDDLRLYAHGYLTEVDDDEKRPKRVYYCECRVRYYRGR